MQLDAWPIGLIFVATVAVVMLSIEAGFGLARFTHRNQKEKETEAPVSGISGSILGLLAFMLAFTFGMVSDRFDARKSLVREEANAIGTAYLRTDFLPEPDRSHAAELYRQYVDLRLASVRSNDLGQLTQALEASNQIQNQLWAMAASRQRDRLDSPLGALYVDALNHVIDVQALRVAVGLQTRIPGGVWLALYALIVLAMFALGYQTWIAGSRRTWASLLLALSFSLVIALIVSLDRPDSGFITVSQQPMVDLRASMHRPAPGTK
jgi:hypothetical protein